MQLEYCLVLNGIVWEVCFMVSFDRSEVPTLMDCVRVLKKFRFHVNFSIFAVRVSDFFYSVT
jgi:hypothetical protein